MKKLFLFVLLGLLTVTSGCQKLQQPPPEILKNIVEKSIEPAIGAANPSFTPIKSITLDPGMPTYVLGDPVKKQNSEGIQVDMWPLSIKYSGVLENPGTWMNMHKSTYYQFSISYVAYIYKNHLKDGPPYRYEVSENGSFKSSQVEHKLTEQPLPESAAPKN